jgi:hypothetical protein
MARIVMAETGRALAASSFCRRIKISTGYTQLRIVHSRSDTMELSRFQCLEVVFACGSCRDYKKLLARLDQLGYM